MWKAGKLRLDLIPVRAVEEIARAFESGLAEHPEWDWITVDNWQDIYYGATMRHLFEWRKGVKKDKKSGLHPLAHAGANILIMLTRSINDYMRPGRDVDRIAFSTMSEGFLEKRHPYTNGPSEDGAVEAEAECHKLSKRASRKR